MVDADTSLDTQIFGIIAAILTQLLQSLGLTIQRKAHLRFQYHLIDSEDIHESARLAEDRRSQAGSQPATPNLGTSSSPWTRIQGLKLKRTFRRLLRLPSQHPHNLTEFTFNGGSSPSPKRKRLIFQPLWVSGFVMYISAGLIGTPFQLSALPILVLAPLGSISLVTNAIFATTILGDPFTRPMLIGTAFVFAGTIAVAYYGRIPEQVLTLSETLELYKRPGIVAYFLCLAFVMVLFLIIIHNAENHPNFTISCRAWITKGFKHFILGLTRGVVGACRPGGRNSHEYRSFFDDDAQPLVLGEGGSPSASRPQEAMSSQAALSRHRLRRPSLMINPVYGQSSPTVSSRMTSPTLPGPFGALPPLDYGTLSNHSPGRTKGHHRSRSSISRHRQSIATQQPGSSQDSRDHIKLSKHESMPLCIAPTSPRMGRRNEPSSPIVKQSRIHESDRLRLVLGGSFALVSGTLSGLVLLFAKTGVAILVFIFDGGRDGSTSRLTAALEVFSRWDVWAVIAGIVIPGLTQLIYLSHSLRLASPTLVCPISFITYTLASISSSLVYSGQTKAIDLLSWLALMGGLILTGAGVWIISGTASDPVVRPVMLGIEDEALEDTECDSDEDALQ